MTKEISKHSKSFAWLFGIAFLGTILALLTIWQSKHPGSTFSKKDYQTLTYDTAKNQETTPAVDTSQWLEYQNEKYGLKFKYDPEWKVRSLTNKDGYYVIEIDPGKKYDNFRVFISEDDYFALSGVPLEKTTIAGREAVDLEGQVLGVKDNTTYFTFDMGASLSLKPYFTALVDTVQFIR